MTTLADADIAVCELPPMLQLLVEVAGLPASLALAGRYGGTEVCIPVKLDPDSDLVATVGLESASRIAHHFRGEKIYVPKGDHALRCLRNRIIAREYDREGVTAGELALKHGLTERQVRNILGTTVPVRVEQLVMEF
ncbi:MAG: hypothetical protein HQL95_02245 [Magnetococcales bacterium]|nr:hypothetical protein [Magnetococcales bacterium]